jgi:hypothetical protein
MGYGRFLGYECVMCRQTVPYIDMHNTCDRCHHLWA